jgi:hypothetical protein
VIPLRKKVPSGQPAQRGWVTPKKLGCPAHSPPGYEESYQERTITQQKNDKKKRTSALHSRYDTLKETHESKEKGHEVQFEDWNRKISKRNRNRKSKNLLLQGRKPF